MESYTNSIFWTLCKSVVNIQNPHLHNGKVTKSQRCMISRLVVNYCSHWTSILSFKHTVLESRKGILQKDDVESC